MKLLDEYFYPKKCKQKKIKIIVKQPSSLPILESKISKHSKKKEPFFCDIMSVIIVKGAITFKDIGGKTIN